MNDHKNTILAIVLSGMVLIAWQYFIGLPQLDRQRQQTQQQADTLEKRWRQLGIRRQLEEWQRLKGLAQGLSDAEQHVLAVHQQQGQLTLMALNGAAHPRVPIDADECAKLAKELYRQVTGRHWGL